MQSKDDTEKSPQVHQSLEWRSDKNNIIGSFSEVGGVTGVAGGGGIGGVGGVGVIGVIGVGGVGGGG